jgi:Tol biopolymer transport system component
MRLKRLSRKSTRSLIPLVLVIGMAAIVCAALALQNSSQHKVLFEKAKFTMETKGDLKGAIALFEEIIKKYPNEREYAARSLYLMGTCYERLGERQTQQAQAAFQRIVHDYPDQTAEVNLAKEKLLFFQKPRVLIEPGGGDVRLRKFLDFGTIGPPSMDGRLFPCWDDSGNLAVMDIWGKERRLTDDASWEKGDFADSAIISPDGGKVAYGWWHKGSTAYDLKVVSIDGSGQRILYSKSDIIGNAGYLSPLDWTPDGQRILGFLRKEGGGTIGFISIADGSYRGIKDIGKQNMGRLVTARLSPDGRWIAYDYLQNGKSDVFIMTADGSREIALEEHPADDFIMDWTPQNSILMASDRSGSWDAWLVSVKDGKAEGDPTLVKRDFGQPYGATGISPLGFSRDGAFYYVTRSWMEEVYVATVDPEKRELIVPPKKPAQSFEGANCYPDWSPDGKYLAFTSRRGPMSSALCLISFDTAEQRDIVPSKTGRLIRLNWHPDGKSVVVVGGGGIQRVDIESGHASPVVTEGDGFHSPRCTPDGKYVYYGGDYSVKDKDSRIMRVNLETKEKTEIYRSAQQIIRLDISPDGRSLAFLEFADRALKVMSIDGGQPRVVHKFDKSKGWGRSVAWSPDGKYLFYAKTPEEEDKTGQIELWRIPSAGGEPVRLPLTAKGMENLRIHPDGRRIAFNTSEMKNETWVMENFLPKAAGNK